jgi:dipeptidyl aminopeptidase/acylaminoacyl peptidase
LFFSVDEDARVKLFHYRISTNKLTLFIQDGHNGNALVVPNSQFVIISRDSMSTPSDVWQFTFYRDTFNSLKQLTAYNQALLSSIWMSSPQRFYFQSNGTQIQGWLLLPYGWDTAKKWPLVQLIHGLYCIIYINIISVGVI